MALGFAEAIILIPMLFALGIFIAALVDVLSHPKSTWEAAGQNQILWFAVILLVPFIGSIIYLTTVRRDLDRFDAPAAAVTR